MSVLKLGPFMMGSHLDLDVEARISDKVPDGRGHRLSGIDGRARRQSRDLERKTEDSIVAVGDDLTALSGLLHIQLTAIEGRNSQDPFRMLLAVHTARQHERAVLAELFAAALAPTIPGDVSIRALAVAQSLLGAITELLDCRATERMVVRYRQAVDDLVAGLGATRPDDLGTFLAATVVIETMAGEWKRELARVRAETRREEGEADLRQREEAASRRRADEERIGKEQAECGRQQKREGA